MRIAASVAALLALSLTLAGGAHAATKKATKAARHHVSVADTRHAILAAADHGDAEAQYKMGQAYRDGGHGVKADAQVALSWFMLAGAGGNLAAAEEAAKAYEAGRGAKRDLNEAANWWYQAGILGNEAARKRWMALFVDGEVHAIRGADGVAWLTQAAKEGDLKAMMALAEAEENGVGGARNLALAEDLYRRAALFHGDVEARYRLGRMLLARPAQWRKPATEIWDAKEAADKGKPFGAVWYPVKPPDSDDTEVVQLRPGINEGEYWLLSAARRGHADAQYLLGVAKVTGMELPFDLYGGVGWLEAAAAQGNADALTELGNLAASGQGFFAKDPVRAFVMYDLAATQGDTAAKAARDAVAKGLNQRQMTRSRQLVQELKELAGL